MKALDFLINQREFELAVFFKGFILKYGLKPYLLPDLVPARQLLERSAKGGVGPALWELRYFDRYGREFEQYVPKVRREL